MTPDVLELNSLISDQSNLVDGALQYLTFKLADEMYGVHILSVLEIRGLEKLTTIPGAPQNVRGILNLRGKVIPIYDLRAYFKMSHRDYDAMNVNIILNIKSDDSGSEIQTIGIIVDSVSDVKDIIKENISTSKNFGAKLASSFIEGFTTDEDEDEIIILLNANIMFDEKEIKNVRLEGSPKIN